MLKTKIMEALKAAFPDVQDPRQFEHAVDVIMELLLPVHAEAIGKAIKAYEGDDR